MKNLYFIILSLFAFCYVIKIVKEKKFSIKESFWWVILSIVMLLLSIFPYSIDWFAAKLGVSYSPSLLFVICIVFLIFMNFKDSRRISELQLKMIDLEQELAVLKEKVNRK